MQVWVADKINGTSAGEKKLLSLSGKDTRKKMKQGTEVYVHINKNRRVKRDKRGVDDETRTGEWRGEEKGMRREET